MSKGLRNSSSTKIQKEKTLGRLEQFKNGGGGLGWLAAKDTVRKFPHWFKDGK